MNLKTLRMVFLQSIILAASFVGLHIGVECNAFHVISDVFCFRYFKVLVVSCDIFIDIRGGLYSLCGKTSYNKILRSLEPARLGHVKLLHPFKSFNKENTSTAATSYPKFKCHWSYYMYEKLILIIKYSYGSMPETRCWFSQSLSSKGIICD